MLFVFLEFLGHGEFKFQKSCQKLYPSLRYQRLVFIPFLGHPLGMTNIRQTNTRHDKP